MMIKQRQIKRQITVEHKHEKRRKLWKKLITGGDKPNSGEMKYLMLGAADKRMMGLNNAE